MFENLPEQLLPVYAEAGVDEPIELFQGVLELNQNGEIVIGSGSLQFQWIPITGIVVRFTTPTDYRGIGLGKAILRIPEMGVSVDTQLVLTPMIPGTGPIEGIVGQLNRGNQDSCTRLRFHLANLPAYFGSSVRTCQGGASAKRLSFNYLDWEIIMDAVDRNQDELVQRRGFRITHLCALSKRDGSSFSLDDAEPALESLGYFFSFCRGGWTRPFLFSLEDPDGQSIGDRWETVFIDRYRQVHSWVPSTEPISGHLGRAFEGFAQKWFSSDWHDAIRTATEWYIDSSAGAAEKSIVVLQAALETLAWTSLVGVNKQVGKKNWKGDFHEKLRRLLTSCSIPIQLPSSLASLHSYCLAEGIEDGPKAVTQVRNALVHPTPRRRKSLRESPASLVEAWILGMWYLDLLMLHIFDFMGTYSDRTVRSGWRGEEVKAVPWNTEAESRIAVSE
jgi:hypothetical protein